MVFITVIQSEKLLYHLCKDALQMFTYSEDDVRRGAETREWLIKQISDKQEEVERLRTILSIIDNLLKQSSFRAASSFRILFYYFIINSPENPSFSKDFNPSKSTAESD